VGGVVTQVTAELGQTVKRGQALAQLFSRDLAEAQTAYLSTSAELEAEHKKLVRTQELVRLGAASRQELEEIEANHQVHAAHVAEARQKLLLLGLDEQQVADVAAGRKADTNIAIPAPLDGVVTARNVNLGQVVTAAQDLLTITDLSSVWVEANLLENDFGAVHVGTQATITTPAYARRQYRGVVSYIEPQVDPQTRTSKVRVAVENPGFALRLGMYMEVLFTSPAGASVPVVPKQALQVIGPTSIVFVPVEGEPGRFLQRTVKTGEESVAGYRVLEGLKSGETVVTDGSFLLRAEALRQHP
jgi:membrane fusion protein, heavy metal efflux system